MIEAMAKSFLQSAKHILAVPCFLGIFHKLLLTVPLLHKKYEETHSMLLEVGVDYFNNVRGDTYRVHYFNTVRGDTGNGLCQWVRDEIQQDFSFPHIQVMYPTAPARPYSPMNGMHSTVWFDRKQISPFVAEDDSLHSMGKSLSDLISTELDKNGLSEDRLIIGGFSMGGCMALHLAYKWHKRVAGVFALSAFLNKESAVYKELEDSDEPKAPLFQCHGERDTLVLYDWGFDTHKRLTELGVPTEFQAFPVLYHQFNKRQILMLKEWIFRILPETPPT